MRFLRGQQFSGGTDVLAVFPEIQAATGVGFESARSIQTTDLSPMLAGEGSIRVTKSQFSRLMCATYFRAG